MVSVGVLSSFYVYSAAAYGQAGWRRAVQRHILPTKTRSGRVLTGRKPPKSKWKFTKIGEDWLCFAGLWRPMPEGVGEAFTLLTTEPGPDVAPIHDRQMVVLERADWLAWLDLTRPEAELLRPLPRGSLVVEQVR